jgi:hypothetical protein
MSLDWLRGSGLALFLKLHHAPNAIALKAAVALPRTRMVLADHLRTVCCGAWQQIGVLFVYVGPVGCLMQVSKCSGIGNGCEIANNERHLTCDTLHW